MSQTIKKLVFKIKSIDVTMTGTSTIWS